MLGRDQCTQALDEFQGHKPQLRVPIGLRLVEAIDKLIVAELFEPLKGEGRAQKRSTIKTFDPHRPVLGFAEPLPPSTESPVMLLGEFGQAAAF